jgi:hypothetical protein
LPATTWLREFRHVRAPQGDAFSREVIARAASPPLTIQHCTFQI